VSAPWFKRPLFAPLKYPSQAWRTIRLLAHRAPREVWVMDPPLPAVAIAWAYCRRRNVPLVVDMHTVDFYGAKWRALRPLEKPLLRGARAAVVTNAGLEARVLGWRCPAFVLPDPLPTAPAGLDRGVDDDVVTIVATYSDDEPIDLLPEVAERLADLRVHVTGEPRVPTAEWPANLVATGFLADDEYWRQLARSAVVVVLTTRPETLLSGGYERPLVTSDHSVLRDYYGDAVVYVTATADSIASGIREALVSGDELQERMRRLAVVRSAEWDAAAVRLGEMVGRTS
jgi:hypothetical protein